MIARLTALARHQWFHRYFANTSWLFAEKILRMVVGILVGVWVARYLGPERYGLLSYAQSFVGLFSVVATLGLDSILVRELVKDEGKRAVLLGTAFRLKLLGAGAVMLLLAAAVQLTSNDGYTNALIFIVASAIIFQSFNVIDLYFQSKVFCKYVVSALLAKHIFEEQMPAVVLHLAAENPVGILYENQIAFVADRPGHNHCYAIGAGKITRELYRQPAKTFENGIESDRSVDRHRIRKTVLWYIENTVWMESILDGSYRYERLGLEGKQP